MAAAPESRSRTSSPRSASSAFQAGSGEPATWRQKITVTVETPEGPRTGSAVQEVTLAADAPRLTGERGTGAQRWSGGAVLVEVMGEGAAPNAPRWLVVLAHDPVVLARRFGGKHDEFDEWTGKVSAAKGEPIAIEPLVAPGPWAVALSERAVAEANGGGEPTVPAADPPHTVRALAVAGEAGAPSNETERGGLARVFGPGVRLGAVTLEIVDEAPTDGPIRALLGSWLDREGEVPGPLMRVETPDGPRNIGPTAFVSPDRLPTPSWVTDEATYREAVGGE